MMANEIILDAGLKPDTSCNQYSEPDFVKLYKTFQDWADSVSSGNFQPCCLYDVEGNPLDCSALPIRYPGENLTIKPVSSISRAVTEVYGSKQARERFQGIKAGLLKKVGAVLEKNRIKLGKQEKEAAHAERGDEWRILGELLITYGSQIQKGSKVARLANHYQPESPEMEIPLNPALSIWENAQQYFKKYQKAKKGRLAIAAQIAKTRESIDYLESIEVMIENAVNLSDLKLIRDELDLAETKHFSQKKPPKRKEVRQNRAIFRLGGHTLLVGRNNLQKRPAHF